MRLPVGFLLVAGLATVLVVGGGVLTLGDDSDDPEPHEAPFTTTALADYDTTTAEVTRGPSATTSTTARSTRRSARCPTRSSGRTATRWSLTGTGQADVVHEFGCSYASRTSGPPAPGSSLPRSTRPGPSAW